MSWNARQSLGRIDSRQSLEPELNLTIEDTSIDKIAETDKTSEHELIEISDYDAPAAPTDEAVRRLFHRFWLTINKHGDQPYVAENSLHHTELEKLDEIVAPPACGPLVDDLSYSIDKWLSEVKPTRLEHIYVVLLPPGDRNNILLSWAEKKRMSVLQPPQRTELLDPNYKLPRIDVASDEPLVVPGLERWYLRHPQGLSVLRKLLDEITSLKRPCVIGCNSWAYKFLSKAVGLHLLLPTPLTFEPFNAERLGDWFSELAEAEDATFRSVKSGQDVLKLTKSDELQSDYLSRLASRSLGIPWVAWHLWRTSLRSRSDEKDSLKKSKNDNATYWIADLQEAILPSQNREDTLFILHALLMHEQLSLQELRLVIPSDIDATILLLLERCSFVVKEDGQYSISAAKYPGIRQELLSAGFPGDDIV